jgi:hypothetical protein
MDYLCIISYRSSQSLFWTLHIFNLGTCTVFKWYSSPFTYVAMCQYRLSHRSLYLVPPWESPKTSTMRGFIYLKEGYTETETSQCNVSQDATIKTISTCLVQRVSRGRKRFAQGVCRTSIDVCLPLGLLYAELAAIVTGKLLKAVLRGKLIMAYYKTRPVHGIYYYYYRYYYYYYYYYY